MEPSLSVGFDLVFGLLLGVVGFFVKQVVNEQHRRGLQIETLTQRIVILEERERGNAQQIEEIKAAIEGLAIDMRFVRERLVLFTENVIEDRSRKRG